MDRVHDPMGVHHVLTCLALGHTCDEIVIATLPVLIQARENRCKLLWKYAWMNQFLVEAAQHLSMTRIGFSSRQKHGTDGMKGAIIGARRRIAPRAPIQQKPRRPELLLCLGKHRLQLVLHKATPSRMILQAKGNT